MKRSHKVGLAIVAILVGLLAAGWAFLYEPMRLDFEWTRRVGADLNSLRQKRPLAITPVQWEYAVDWTVNMHYNTGDHPFISTVELAWRDRFVAELEHRLQGPVTLADIDWIWDEYAAHVKGGQQYSDRYRPTRDPNVFPR